MAQPSKGDRKQIAGRLPLEVFEAFEAKRATLGLGQNEALIVSIKLWLRPPAMLMAPAAPNAPSPTGFFVEATPANLAMKAAVERGAAPGVMVPLYSPKAFNPQPKKGKGR